MKQVLAKHRVLLHDRIRMDAYRAAIRSVVRPGNVVADLGTGTGVLAFEALAAGAAHVHAVEVDPATLAMARKEAIRRGLSEKLTFYRGLSQHVHPKNRVDVVITETLGNFGMNENILSVLLDARTRWLKRGGKTIPIRIALSIVPLGHLPRLGRYKSGGLPSAIVSPQDFLAAPVTPPPLYFRTVRQSTHQARFTMKIRETGLLTAFAGWFTVWLTNRIHFTTAPNAPPTHWQQAILPLRTPVPVRAGQRLKFWLEIAPNRAGLHSIVSYDFALS